MAGMIDALRRLFVEDVVPDEVSLKNALGWESFTYPRCRKCGGVAKINVRDDGYTTNVYRAILECTNQECRTKEIVA